MKKYKLILPIIVISQFCCTSLWFAGNGVMSDIIADFNLKASALGHLTAAVQFGFILGTLIFAILTIADRFSPVPAVLITYNIKHPQVTFNIPLLSFVIIGTGGLIASYEKKNVSTPNKA